MFVHPVLSFQVSACDFIYLVSKQNAFFGFSSSSNQYWSYESRSSWLLWLLCLHFSLPFCLYQSLSLSLPLFLFSLYSLFIFVFFLSIPVSFFSSSVLTVCLPPPTLPHLKNYFAHLDRALHGRCTISPLVALIKNRSEYRVRISQDFSSSPASPCLPSSYAEFYWLMLEMDVIESEKFAAKCPSPPFFSSAHSLCVCVVGEAVSVCQ